MPRVSIMIFKPQKDKLGELIALLKQSRSTLLKFGKVTAREQILAMTIEESVIQILEWTSKEAEEEAAVHDEVRELWMQAERISEFQKPIEVREFNQMFPSFEVIK